MESNQLTSDGTSLGGINEFIEFLKYNKTLISLNLANNQLEQPCGDQFKNNLENNFSLIDFDYSLNNFALEDSRRIQDLLRRNKKKYDEERLREWKERKRMKAEDEALMELQIKEDTAKQIQILEEEDREQQEKELNERWAMFMKENEIEKQQLIQQLKEQSKAKPKRKGKGKGGKGKKKK